MRTRWVLNSVVAIALAALTGGSQVAQSEKPSPVVRIDEIRAAYPLKEGDAQASVELLRGAGVSTHLIQVRSRVRPHYHKDHEETVYLLDGEGIFILADRVYPVKAGALIMIPKGTVHSFEAKKPTTVLSIFDPPFDGADRIFVDEASPTP